MEISKDEIHEKCVTLVEHFVTAAIASLVHNKNNHWLEIPISNDGGSGNKQLT